jgi:HlyD family secretion protein
MGLGFVRLGITLLLPSVLLTTGCGLQQQGQAQPQGSQAGQREEQPPVVDIATATPQTIANNTRYNGTTQPLRTVSLRSRVEGQLLCLAADVGDRVNQGEPLARLDNALLIKEIAETQAELAARQFEVEQARSQLAEAQARVEQAQAQLKQAQADADRLTQLAQEGAISDQDAEVAQTNLRTAEQALRSAQEQVKTRERAIASVERRVAAQAAIVDQAAERSTYASLAAPLTGTVLQRLAEPGDLIQPGQMLLELGDLSQINIAIRVSDRDLSQFNLGQAVEVRLDAFPTEVFRGTVTQISPVADAAARLVPVEVTIPNPDRQMSSGLLARVNVATRRNQTLRIPETALQVAQPDAQTESQADSSSVVFVPVSREAETMVEARPVQLGQRDNGQVEILTGLRAGEAFVVNSDKPLEAGQTVRRSFLSES